MYSSCDSSRPAGVILHHRSCSRSPGHSHNTLVYSVLIGRREPQPKATTSCSSQCADKHSQVHYRVLIKPRRTPDYKKESINPSMPHIQRFTWHESVGWVHICLLFTGVHTAFVSVQTIGLGAPTAAILTAATRLYGRCTVWMWPPSLSARTTRPRSTAWTWQT